MRRVARGSREPRVLLYTDAHELGGAEVYMGHLLELLPDRFELAFVATDPRVLAYLAARKPSVAAHKLPRIRSRVDLLGVIRHLGFLIRYQPDILHLNLNRPWGSKWALLAGLLSPGVRVVLVEHSPRRPAALRHNIYLRVLSPRADAFVATSEASASVAAALMGIDRRRMTVILPGVPDLPAGSPPADRDGAPMIGTLARLDAEKGIDVLLTALTELPEVHATVVGDGDERAALEHLARSLRIGDRVTFTGWSEEPRRWLTGMDVFVLPSRLEAMPLSVIEAMLSGLPVIATRVGGVAEQLGATGVLIPPDDAAALRIAISGLLADGERRQALGAAARERALTRFSAATMAAQFAALYDRLMMPR